jgi:hypothetical protein
VTPSSSTRVGFFSGPHLHSFNPLFSSFFFTHFLFPPFFFLFLFSFFHSFSFSLFFSFFFPFPFSFFLATEGYGKWTQITGTGPSARCNHRMVAVGDRIFMVGGRAGETTLFNDVHVLDTTKDTWSSPPVSGTVPEVRDFHSLVAFEKVSRRKENNSADFMLTCGPRAASM